MLKFGHSKVKRFLSLVCLFSAFLSFFGVPVCKAGKDGLVKVVLVGDSGSGKTSLRLRFLEDRFDINVKPTVGYDRCKGQICVEGNNVSFVIDDPSGKKDDEEQRQWPRICLRAPTDGGLMYIVRAFDLSAKKTEEEVRKNFDEWDEFIADSNKSSDIKGVVKEVIVGTKKDVKNENVKKNEAFLKKVCEEKGCASFISTSAMTGENVKEVFEFIGRDVLESEKLARKIEPPLPFIVETKTESNPSDIKKFGLIGAFLTVLFAPLLYACRRVSGNESEAKINKKQKNISVADKKITKGVAKKRSVSNL